MSDPVARQVGWWSTRTEEFVGMNDSIIITGPRSRWQPVYVLEAEDD